MAFLLALLFLLLPVSSSADVVLTEEEYQTILDALTTSELELTTSQEELKKLKDQLEESKLESIRLQTTLTELGVTLATLKINSELQSKSYEQLKTRVDLIWIDRVGFGLIGLGIGAGGMYLLK